MVKKKHTKTTKRIAYTITTIVVLVVVLYIVKINVNPVIKNEKNTIKIGVIYPLSGGLSFLGNQFLDGTNIAVDEVNANGGINGKKVSVIVEDASDQSNAISSFNKLTDIDKTNIVFTTLSKITLALIPIADNKKTILFSFAAHPNITGTSDYVFRYSNIADKDAEVISNFIINNLSSKRVGVLYIQDDWGVVFNNKIKEIAEKNNISVYSEPIISTQTDPSVNIDKILFNNPDAIIIVAYGKIYPLIFKKIKEKGYNGQIITNVAFTFMNLPKIIDKDVIKGIYYATIPNENNKIYNKFKNESMSKYNEEPTIMSFISYISTKIILKAIEETNSTNPDVISKFLRNRTLIIDDLTVNISDKGDIPLVTKIFRYE